ncbi:hypothetical protein ACJJI5_14790 [Microbulbifer sp. EKSA008]|uniref:hypothetical protein n=1 Tax=Microbulbifer sp. EKSA008 TaxID=3243367 RepID=UPI004041830D
MQNSDLQEPIVFVVGYSYVSWINALLLSCLLGALCYRVYLVGNCKMVFKYKSLMIFFGAWLLLICMSVYGGMSQRSSVQKSHEALAEGRGIGYVEGDVVYEEKPWFRGDDDGPQMSFAKIDGVLFVIYNRSSSECINRKLAKKVGGDGNIGLVYRAWYIEEAKISQLEEVQDFSPCLIRLEIISASKFNHSGSSEPS